MLQKGKIKRKRLVFILLIFFIVSILLLFTYNFSDNTEVIFLRFVVGFIIVYLLIKGTKEKFIVNPYFLFALTPLSLLMYTETVSEYYLMELTSNTWVFATINIFAFAVALSVTKPFRNIPSYERNEEYDLHSLETHIVIMTAISVLPVLYKLFFHRTMFIGSVITYFAFLALTAAIKSKKKSSIYFMLGYFFLNFLASFNKTILISIAFTTFISIEKYIMKDKRQRGKIIVFVIAFIIVLFTIGFPLKAYMATGGSFIGFFTGVEIINDDFNGYGDRIDLGQLNIIKMPYMYFVSAWNNVQYVMQTQQSHTYGLWLLKPILGYLQLDGFFSDEYRLIPYSSFNTFSFVTVLYKDFGYWGSIMESVFLGWFVKKVYTRCLNSSSLFWTGCYAMTACAVLEMFFSNHFFMLSYPFTIIIISYIYRLIFRKSKNI